MLTEQKDESRGEKTEALARVERAGTAVVSAPFVRPSKAGYLVPLTLALSPPSTQAVKNDLR